jgi:RNA polymerase sigma-70 factor (ECF subfamily)
MMAPEEEHWSVWLAEHGRALVLLARQWVGRRADAEDAVQEAFIRAWKSRQRVADPVAYLYASVKHAALDIVRGQNRRQRREEATTRGEATPLLVCGLEQDERRVAIEAALASLPRDQAEVLVMKIWGGLTMPRIAAALEISANTAASRYRYALAKLREVLAEEMIP